MRRLLILTVAVLASAIASAQNDESVTSGDLFSPKVTEILDGKGELMRFHGSLIFSESNESLLPSDVTGQFWRKYSGARILQDYGQYIWLFGLSYMATDLTISLIYGRDVVNLSKDPNIFIGGFCILFGGTMDYWGWKRLGNLAKTYNTDPSVRKGYSLDFGPTRSGGFGLALNF